MPPQDGLDVSRGQQGGADEESLERFIKSAFRSIWSIELLLLMRGRPDQGWSQAELIAGLRASEQVLARSIADLEGADLVQVDGELIRYHPGSASLGETVGALEQLYSQRPAKVRRLILGGSEDQLTRFADAFRLKGTGDE